MGLYLSYVESMKAFVWSLGIKILLVAFTCVTIYQLGLSSEGKADFGVPILLMWYNHLASLVPVFSYGDVTSNVIYALSNGFFLIGSLLSLYIIHLHIGIGGLRKPGWRSIFVVSLIAVFCTSTICHYVGVFIGQERTFAENGLLFATYSSARAFNSYDNIICIAILLQIIQAFSYSAFKKNQKISTMELDVNLS